jgi:hypothetical protein
LCYEQQYWLSETQLEGQGYGQNEVGDEDVEVFEHGD